MAIKGYGVDLEPSDSASQVTECYSIASSKALARQIELDRRRAELRAYYDLAKAKAHAEAEAHGRVEEARLDAKERRIALSERGSLVALSR